MRLSLAGRLSAFFLVALAAVLIGFSAALYLLARTYLHRQVDARLAAALDTLAAAAEVEPGGVSWEPEERRLTLGTDPGEDQVRWLIRDEAGRAVDRSANSAAADPPPGWDRERGPAPPGRRTLAPWRVEGRRLQPDRRGAPGPGAEPSLVLLAAASLRPAAVALRNLALALAVLSAALWLLAAALGLRLSRRALAPLTRMAAAAREMTADDRGQRLPGPGTGDELADLGGAFNGLLDRLNEAFQRQRQFTGDASHQLRTPLAAMRGQVEVALRRDRPAEEYRRVLGLVLGRAAQLGQIVESLLYLARADAEVGRPALEAVDLAAWVPAHLQSWDGHPRAPDLAAAVPPDGPAWARVHRPLLGQALDNLLDNACKYSEPGTPIVVRVERGPTGPAVAVEDRGEGVPAEELPHLFEPFYRSPRARHRQAGSGLGLAVARRIVAAFGGAILVRSEPGAGSRFVIDLPDPENGPGLSIQTNEIRTLLD